MRTAAGRARRDALFLLAGSGTADLAFRITQVAFPLVVLQQTGSVAATGLAGGASGIPVVLSPWWARKARQWVDSGPRLAVVAAVQAVALAMVPAAAVLGLLGPEVLIASGLLLGCGDALATPGRAALLADTGDRWGPDKAVLLLTWQDGIRRAGMVVGPPLGALAIAAGFTDGLLWVEAGTVLVAGLLAVSVTGERSPAIRELPSIRASLVGRSDVLYGWIVRGAGCFTWFAFTLGLSVLGGGHVDLPGTDPAIPTGTADRDRLDRRRELLDRHGCLDHTGRGRSTGSSFGCDHRAGNRGHHGTDHLDVGRCAAACVVVGPVSRGERQQFGRPADRGPGAGGDRG